MPDIWADFDALCAVQNEQIQLSLENDTRTALLEAFTSGRGLYEAVTDAIGIATEDQTWKDIVEVLRERPSMLNPEVDGKFYKGCPKPILETLMAGDKGLLAQFLGRLNDPKRPDLRLAGPDIRLMHMIVDTLMTMGQIQRLKKFAGMLAKICSDTKRSDGQIPRSVRDKLLKNNIIQKTDGQQHSAPKRPVCGDEPPQKRNNSIGPAAAAVAARVAGTREERANYAFRVPLADFAANGSVN